MYGIGGGLGMLLLAKFFTGARRHNFMTMSEEISFYYGANRRVKGVVALFILFASVGWLGAHIIGGSYYLEYVGGVDPIVAKIALAASFAIYVIIGGYVAVVWTDTIQAIVLFAGFILMAVFAIKHVGGLSSMESMNRGQFNFLHGSELLPSVSLAVAIMVGVLGTPSYRQRIYSADSVETVKKSFYLSGALYLLFCFIPAIIGICAHQINPSLEKHDYAFLFMARDTLPIAIGVIVLVAGLSATMSSASSDAIAAVSILFRDVYVMFAGKMPDKHKMVSYSRWGLTAITIAALAVTIPARDIIQYIKGMIAFVMSGLVVCAFMGRFWPRATWQGGIAAIIGGGFCTAVFMLYDPLDTFWGGAAIPSVVCAAITGLLISLMTPPNTVSSEKALEILAKERRAMEVYDEPDDPEVT